MELISSALAWLIAAFAGFLGHIFAHDFCEKSPKLAHKIINSAARILPSRDRKRYVEEWESHLIECETVYEKFKHAFGCLICAYSLKRVSTATAKSRPKEIEFQFGDHAAKLNFSPGGHALLVIATSLQLSKRAKKDNLPSDQERLMSDKEMGELLDAAENMFGALDENEFKQFSDFVEMLNRAAAEDPKPKGFKIFVDGKPAKRDDFFPT